MTRGNGMLFADNGTPDNPATIAGVILSILAGVGAMLRQIYKERQEGKKVDADVEDQRTDAEIKRDKARETATIRQWRTLLEQSEAGRQADRQAYNTRLSAMEQKIEGLQDKERKCEITVATLTKDNAHQSQKIDELQGEVRDLRQQLSDLKDEMHRSGVRDRSDTYPVLQDRRKKDEPFGGPDRRRASGSEAADI